MSPAVTVYRLICKNTVEEKILQRAGKKITVQQLVMAGGHAHSEVLAPGDVVSLLLDDSELEKKIKERFSIQGKERQLKSKRTVVRFDAEGNASLEDSNLLSRQTEIEESRKGKGRQKKSKRTLNQFDAEGNASLEDSTNPLPGETEIEGSGNISSLWEI